MVTATEGTRRDGASQGTRDVNTVCSFCGVGCGLTVKLEALVRELELNTIKAHINPHFIFNSLNGIRALIDENPERARTAITQLSSILRSSLTTEKAETVALEQELKIAAKARLLMTRARGKEREWTLI